jgi:hypothetical protein
MHLQKKTVWQAVKSWAVIYPSAQKRTQAEEAAIATEFFFSLEGDLSDDEFQEASRMVKKSSRFFPTIAQVLELKDAAIRQLARKKNLIALPEDNRIRMSAEEAAAGLKNYRKLIELAKREDLTHDQMAEEMEKFVESRRKV